MPDLYIELEVHTRDGQTIVKTHDLPSSTLISMPVAKLVEMLCEFNHENILSYNLQVNKKS